MKIEALHIQNFGAIGEAKFELSDKGLVLIQGVNEDDSSAASNGAGKSTIPDALCWALFGVTARGDSGDKVVNRTAGKDCLVTVHISDGTHSWGIARARKHAAHKNRLMVWQHDSAGSVFDLTKGTDKDTQALVERIIGCTGDVFLASIYAGQERMCDLPALTDKQLKELIEEAAGITRLQRAYELAREGQREAEKALDHYSLECNRWKDREETAVVAEAAARGNHAEWHRKWVEQLAVLDREIDHEAALLAALNAKEVRYNPALDAEHAALIAQLNGHKSENDTLVTLTKAAHDAERIAAVTSAEMTRIARLLREAKHDFDHVEDALAKPCPECGKPHTAEERDELRALRGTRLKTRAEEYKAIKARFETELAAQHAAEQAVEKHKSAMTDISELAAKIKAMSEVIRERDELRGKIKTQQSAIAQRQKRARELAAEINPFVAVIDKAVADLKRVREEAAAHSKTGASLAERFDLAKSAVEVFGPAGVRAHILDTVTPLLNARTAEYLNHLSDGNLSATWSTIGKTAKGDLREKFNIEVTSTTAGESFSSLSGGEKRKVRLACALALQDLVASRASKPIELFIGDEIDHALDPAGLERLMGVLEMKAKERGTVLVISHGDLTDWIRQVVTVTKSGGYSSASGALVV